LIEPVVASSEKNERRRDRNEPDFQYRRQHGADVPAHDGGGGGGMGGESHHGNRSCYNRQEQRAPSKERRSTLEGRAEPELRAPEGGKRAEYSTPPEISTKLRSR